MIVVHRLGGRIEEPMPGGAEVAFMGPDKLAARTVFVHVFSWPATMQMNPELADLVRDNLPFLVQPIDGKIFGIILFGGVVLAEAYNSCK